MYIEHKKSNNTNKNVLSVSLFGYKNGEKSIIDLDRYIFLNNGDKVMLSYVTIEEYDFYKWVITSNGKLLYVNIFYHCKMEKNQELLCRNQNICSREERDGRISVFNENGNVLLLKGVYKEIWNSVKYPIPYKVLVDILVSKSYEPENTEKAIKLLINKSIIFSKNCLIIGE